LVGVFVTGNTLDHGVYGVRRRDVVVGLDRVGNALGTDAETLGDVLGLARRCVPAAHVATLRLRTKRQRRGRRTRRWEQRAAAGARRADRDQPVGLASADAIDPHLAEE